MKTPDDVVDSLAKIGKIYNRQLDAGVVGFFAEVLLSKLTADEACHACAQWAASQTRWPSPADLIHQVKPKASPRDEATATSQALIALIGRRGYTWEDTCKYDGHHNVLDAVKAEAGEAAAQVVVRCGGWAAFCRQFGGEEGDGTLRAQLRDLCSAVASGAGPSMPLLRGKSSGPMHIGEILRGQLNQPRERNDQ